MFLWRQKSKSVMPSNSSAENPYWRTAASFTCMNFKVSESNTQVGNGLCRKQQPEGRFALA